MRPLIVLLLLGCLSAVNSKAMIGTNIGGWLVLEPWITPSLFYRFLDKKKSEGVGMDSYTLCEALGPVEGNRVMHAHWDTWVTEDHIKQLAEREVELVRLPIGDWTLRSYEPYTGCMDGAEDRVNWFLDTCHKYGIKVLLDVHAVKDSQNGFDNSGKANRVVWSDEEHFNHWGNQAGEWMGPWNEANQKYDYINWDNVRFAEETVFGLLDRWGTHPALYAVEPMNEPWDRSDISILKIFYRDVRQRMKEQTPHLKFVFHDSFHFDHSIWNDLFDDNDHENVVLDTHLYTAWDPRRENILEYCGQYKSRLQEVSLIKYDVWVGEWSLATDVCAMWLGGFNDNNTDYQFTCNWIDCPKSYLPEDLAVDFDRTAPVLGPFGQNDKSVVRYGKCPSDSLYFGDNDVRALGQCALHSFDDSNVKAQILWTFRNELEPRWSYVLAYDAGWIKPQHYDAYAE
jgi:glucan 1,3-beta-glucosidase